MADQSLTPVSCDSLVQEIALGLRFDTRKKLHDSEDIMARITAEKLADHLTRANFVIVHGAVAVAPPGVPSTVDRGRT